MQNVDPAVDVVSIWRLCIDTNGSRCLPTREDENSTDEEDILDDQIAAQAREKLIWVCRRADR